MFFLIGKILKLVKKPLAKIGKFFFHFLIIPIFGQYIWLKNHIAQKAETAIDKVIFLFTNRYIVHLLIILIALSVAGSNLLAYEQQENYGRNAIIYKTIGLQDIEVYEDTSTPVEESQINSYLGESSQLTSNAFTEDQRGGTDTDFAATGMGPSVIQGGSTLTKPELASTEEAKTTRTSVREYVIQSGDNIGSIAKQFNLSLTTLLWANKLTSTSLIRPGQKLTIPPTDGVLHAIVRGDTIAKIAQKYRADANKIKAFNNLESDSALTVGDAIMVPGGQIIYTPPKSVYTPPKAVATSPNIGPAVSSSGKMIWPSSCHYITQYYRGWIHTGVDIACDFGTTIYAADDGRVEKVVYAKNDYGYHIIIDHGSGKKTLYGHMSRIIVEPGQSIAKGEIIGFEGSTGRSTGPHLHFEVRLNGTRVNPLNYVR